MKKYVAILLFLTACHSEKQDKPAIAEIQSEAAVIPDITVYAADTSLSLKNGVWFYHQKPFTGFIQSFYPSGSLKSRQSFYNGKDEGLVVSYYEDGSKDARRFYHNGEKDSINQGWWPNGNPRFEYHFKNGVYEGDFKEWYQSGKPLKHIVYHDGKEQSGKGWRENGKLYMSFVVKEGRLYGLVNPNLCYSLKNERGEFVKSSR